MLAGKHTFTLILICLICHNATITTASPIGSRFGKYCSRWFGGCSGQSSHSSPPSSAPEKYVAVHDTDFDPTLYPGSGLPGAPDGPAPDDTLESDPACSTAPSDSSSSSSPSSPTSPNLNAPGPRLERCKRVRSSSLGQSPSPSELSPHPINPESPSISQGSIAGVNGNSVRNRFKNACSKLGNSLTSCFIGSTDTQSAYGESSRWHPSMNPVQEPISQNTMPQSSPQRQEVDRPTASPSANPNPNPPATVNGPRQRASRWQSFRCRWPNLLRGCRPKTSSEPPPVSQPVTEQNQQEEQYDDFQLPPLGVPLGEPQKTEKPTLATIPEETEQDMMDAQGKRPLDVESEPSRNQRPRLESAPMPSAPGFRPSAQPLPAGEGPSSRSSEVPLEQRLDGRDLQMVPYSQGFNDFPHNPEDAMSSIVPDTSSADAPQSPSRKWLFPMSMRTQRKPNRWSQPFPIPKPAIPMPSSPDRQRRILWQGRKSSPLSSPLSAPLSAQSYPPLTEEALAALPVDSRLLGKDADLETTGGLYSEPEALASEKPPNWDQETKGGLYLEPQSPAPEKSTDQDQEMTGGLYSEPQSPGSEKSTIFHSDAPESWFTERLREANMRDGVTPASTPASYQGASPMSSPGISRQNSISGPEIGRQYYHSYPSSPPSMHSAADTFGDGYGIPVA